MQWVWPQKKKEEKKREGKGRREINIGGLKCNYTTEKASLKIVAGWSSHCGAAEMNLSRNHEVVGSIPGLAQWVKDLTLP